MNGGNRRGKNTRFHVTAARTSLRRRERTPAAKSCPTVSSPLPLNPLEIYCLSARLALSPRRGGEEEEEVFITKR